MVLDFSGSGLVKNDGIWYADKKSLVSYPEEGNELCFQLEDNSFWFNHRNNCIVELIKQFPPDGVFYDVGGGNGFVAKAIENAGFETVLLEPGLKGCINAKKRGLQNIICSTIEDANLQKASVSGIGVFDVVEHFSNDIAFLKSFYDYLQVGGKLYITVPAYNILWSNEDDYAGHFNRYTISSLSKKLNLLGYKIVYSTYIFSILPLPVFLFRTIPSKFRKKKSEDNAKVQSSDHKNRDSLSNLWKWELNRIKSGKRIPIGGSCLIIASKS